MVHVSKCVFCFIYYNCIIILLSVTVFVCHDKGNVFLYNKFTSICILETSKLNIHKLIAILYYNDLHVQVRGNASIIHIRPIIKLQKSIIRIIT